VGISLAHIISDQNNRSMIQIHGKLAKLLLKIKLALFFSTQCRCG